MARPRRPWLVSGLLLFVMATAGVGFILYSQTFKTAYWTLARITTLTPHVPSLDGWLSGIDPVNGPIIASVTLVALMSSWRLSRTIRARWLPDAECLSCWTLASIIPATIFLASIQIVAMARMLGWISGIPITGVSALFLLSLYGVSRLLKMRSPLLPLRVQREEYRRLLPKGAAPPLAFVLGTHLICLAIAVLGPPAGGGDGLRYHLPLAANWIRADALSMTPPIWQFSMPSNGELLIWWMLRGGFESLAGVVFFPFGLLAAAAAWALVRQQRGPRFAAASAATAVLAAEIVADQMYKSFIDLFGTAFLAAGILALLMAANKNVDRAQRRLLIVLAGAAMGIACGAKPVFWVLSLAATVVLAVTQVKRTGGRDGRTLVPLFLTAAAACSAFWFVRACLETGNPLYPIHVAIGGHVLLPGVNSDAFIDRPSVLNDLTSLSGLPRFASQLAAAVASIDAYEPSLSPLSVVMIPAGLLAIAFYGTARTRSALGHDRAVIGILAAVMLAIVATILQFRARYGMIYQILCLCWVSLAVARTYRIYPRMVTMILTGTAIAASICTLAGPLDSLAYRLHTADMTRAAFYRIPRTVDDLPAGSRLVNLTRNGRALTYPLHGRGLRNEVVDSMTTERVFRSLRPELSELQQARIEYVYIRAPFPEEWTTAGELELIYDDSVDPGRAPRTLPSRIYRVPR